MPFVTLVIFREAVNAKVGLTAELNCQPVGGASTNVTVHEPVVLPMSVLFPSDTVIVPKVVQHGAPPVAA